MDFSCRRRLTYDPSPLSPAKPISTPPASIEPPQTIKPYNETPNIHGQQQSPQVGQVGGFTQVSQAKKGPNLALIVGTSVLLLVLVVAGIFLSSSGIFAGSKNASGNTGGSTSNTSGSNAGIVANGKGCTKIGILLPETATSARWDSKDKPLLIEDIQNAVPDWNNSTAQTEMDAALTATQNNIQIAYVANDGMATSVIASLKASRLNGRVLVTGQDATVAGLQNILTGDQAMTVYKAITKETQATADLVKAISNGSDTSSLTNGATTKTSDGADIPSVLATPIAVDKTNISSTVLADGFVTKADICQGLPAGTGGIC